MGEFIKVLNEIVMKYYASMDTGARMSILMGDVRRSGVFHSMLTDIVKPGTLEQVIIKAQHNTVSGRRNIAYANNNFIPLAHEYIMVLKKLAPYMIDFQLPKRYEMDIRDSKNATWKDVVAAVLRKLGSEATLFAIYAKVEGYKKTESNPHWKDKVRQVLQQYETFESSSRGVWSIKAA